MRKRNREKRKLDLKNRISMKKLKNGSCSAALSIIAVAAVVLINLIVGSLSDTYTKLDVSDQKLFTVGEQTEEILAGLSEDVQIYFLAQEGSQDTTLEELLNRYEALSDHITVEQKDPVMYPDFVEQYTDEQLSDNSVLVVCGDHARAVDYYDIYVYSMDYSSYSSTLSSFDGEGQITSAIAYVTSDEIPVLYTVEGHQEATLSSGMRSSIEKENMEIRSLNLLTCGSVPEDAQMVLLYAPLSDISAAEKEVLLEYLQRGGHMLWLTGYTDEECPNLDTLLEEYGLQKQPGVVIEEDVNHYIPNYPQYLLPDVKNTEVTADVAGRYVLLPLAQGLTRVSDARDTLEIRELLTTSNSAFSKVDTASDTVERSEEDISGPFLLGAAVTEMISSGEEEDTGENEEAEEGEKIETRLVVFSSEYLLDEQIDAMVSGGNTRLVMSAVSWLSDHEVTISIPGRSMETSYLTVSAGASIFWGLLVTLLLPLSLLVGGGMICYSRRKK